jgi:simple sugar transport system ATP-binding protein
MHEASALGGPDNPHPPSGLPIVEAIGASKRYGATVALSDARVRVMPGESHALVGRDRAGTLVAVMTGLREPDAGEIRFSGEASPPISDREAWRQRVACAYQHSTIILDLTVAENLMVNRQPARHGLISWGGLRRRARWL